MILIIDTYNVLHVTGILPPDLAGIDTAGLIELIRSGRYAHCRAELVCDGTPTGGLARERSGLIRVRYAGPGREADDLIAALIRASSTPRRLVVISGDHFVQREARRRRCRVLESEAFLRQLAEDAQASGVSRSPARKPPSQLTESQVAKWMDIFGVDDEIAADMQDVADEAPAESDGVDIMDVPTGGVTDESHTSHDRSGPPLPESIIAEAERIWREE